MLFKDSPNLSTPKPDTQKSKKEYSQKQMEQLRLYENDAMNKWIQEVLKECEILQKMNNKF